MFDRIDELNNLAACEGFKLPWPAAVIVELEKKGHIVDLHTGLIIWGGASHRITTTVIGEAVAVVRNYEAKAF